MSKLRLKETADCPFPYSMTVAGENDELVFALTANLEIEYADWNYLRKCAKQIKDDAGKTRGDVSMIVAASIWAIHNPGIEP